MERGARSRTRSPPPRSPGAPRTAGTRAPSVVYYLFGGLLTAPLLGAGSLLIWRKRWAGPVALVYAGLAVGIALAVPVHGVFSGSDIPAAQDHLDFVPARLVAVAANTLGTLAVVVVAAATFRRRPLGNALIVLGVAIAAVGNGARRTGRGGDGGVRSGSGSRPVRWLCCAFALIFAIICT